MVVIDKNTRKRHLEDQIEELGSLSRSELVSAWRELFKVDPPIGVKRGLLERATGYQLQAKHCGGLKRETRKVLLAIAASNEPTADTLSTNSSKLVSGSRLIREWHGQTHYVDVTDEGFEWNGDRYSSLSAIALVITGTKWSGPRFFGASS